MAQKLPDDIASFLSSIGQSHLEGYLTAASAEERARLMARLQEIRWDDLTVLYEPPLLDSVKPSKVVTLEERASLEKELEALGGKAYTDGRVAIIMTAGGQGTRLRSITRRAVSPLGPLSGKSMYAMHAEKVVSLSRSTGKAVPYLVMTSPATDAESREFFAKHDNFGLPKDVVKFFVQGTVPSFDTDGRVFLAGPGELVENPDGHGGCLEALARSGLLEWLDKSGFEHLVYVQVDNVLAPVEDPFALGLRIHEKCDIVTKVLKKANPDEKVGALVSIAGKDRIVEYSELAPSEVRMTDDKGELLFRWGSPAMHIIGVQYLATVAKQGYRLPFHRALKKIEKWNGTSVESVQGYKNERFFFDILPAARNVGLEIERTHEFAPVKNATGVDSVDSARALLTTEYSRWLRAAGVNVELPPTAHIEISPRYAATLPRFLERWRTETDRPKSIRSDFLLEK